MSTTFTDGQTCEVFVEATMDEIPFAYSEEKQKWEMQDAAYGVSSHVSERAYEVFCAKLVAQLNSGQTEGKVGPFKWNIC
jgi:hypothetical protein